MTPTRPGFAMPASYQRLDAAPDVFLLAAAPAVLLDGLLEREPEPRAAPVVRREHVEAARDEVLDLGVEPVLGVAGRAAVDQDYGPNALGPPPCTANPAPPTRQRTASGSLRPRRALGRSAGMRSGQIRDAGRFGASFAVSARGQRDDGHRSRCRPSVRHPTGASGTRLPLVCSSGVSVPSPRRATMLSTCACSTPTTTTGPPFGGTKASSMLRPGSSTSQRTDPSSHTPSLR